MDQKQRAVKLRLAWFNYFAHKSKNVAKTCRYFGISRYAYYFWLKRYQKNGKRGLYDRSRKPKTSPRATPLAVRSKIIRIRRRSGFGSNKIALYLAKTGFKVSPKTIYKILKNARLIKS